MTQTNLIVTCEPDSTSLGSRIAQMVATTLEARGARVIVDDLAALRFDPVISRNELESYLDRDIPGDITPLVQHLRSADSLVFIFPVWMFHLPAQMKGYFDRVWRPHVSFALAATRTVPLLTRIRHLTVVATHGKTKSKTEADHEGTVSFFSSSLARMLPSLETNVRFDVYGLDDAAPDRIEAEVERIRDYFASAEAGPGSARPAQGN
ncbi:MAG: NAD(P)H-dependent oxidoreductase [Hyphomicrobiaceae bacterium]